MSFILPFEVFITFKFFNGHYYDSHALVAEWPSPTKCLDDHARTTSLGAIEIILLAVYTNALCLDSVGLSKR